MCDIRNSCFEIISCVISYSCVHFIVKSPFDQCLVWTVNTDKSVMSLKALPDFENHGFDDRNTGRQRTLSLLALARHRPPARPAGRGPPRPWARRHACFRACSTARRLGVEDSSVLGILPIRKASAGTNTDKDWHQRRRIDMFHRAMEKPSAPRRCLSPRMRGSWVLSVRAGSGLQRRGSVTARPLQQRELPKVAEGLIEQWTLAYDIMYHIIVHIMPMISYVYYELWYP